MKSRRWKQAVSILDRLNKRGSEVKRLREWRANLVRELGGEESLTVSKREMVEQAVRTKLALDRADLQPNQKEMDTGTERSSRLSRRLLYTLKLLGLGTDRRVTQTVRPRSRVAEVGARIVREREARERAEKGDETQG